jgi:excisionase family DNA binding protein
MTGPFVPIEDLSKHFSVSVSTIRAWVRQGHIPKDTYIKVGNTYRFSIDDVSVALTTKDVDKPNGNGTSAVAMAGGLDAIGEVSFIEHDEVPDINLDDDM